MTPKFQNSSCFKNYWEKGNGKELLDWANIKPNPQTFQKLSPLYHQIDELGNLLVQETYIKLPYTEASTLIKKYS